MKNHGQSLNRAGPRGVVYGGGGGGGALKAEGLNRAAQEYERGLSPPPPIIGGGSGENFYLIYVSENACQPFLKPIFPYSITSILRSTLKHLVPNY